MKTFICSPTHYRCFKSSVDVLAVVLESGRIAHPIVTESPVTGAKAGPQRKLAVMGGLGMGVER